MEPFLNPSSGFLSEAIVSYASQNPISEEIFFVNSRSAFHRLGPPFQGDFSHREATDFLSFNEPPDADGLQ
jgi:hypothetical protein